MKAKFLVAVVLACVSSIAVSAADYNDDPNRRFNAGTTVTKKITWMPVDNPQKVCDSHSKKVGNGGFAYQVQACAFWTATECTIIVGRRVSQHTAGHEFLHCMIGDWHPQ